MGLAAAQWEEVVKVNLKVVVVVVAAVEVAVVMAVMAVASDSVQGGVCSRYHICR